MAASPSPCFGTSHLGPRHGATQILRFIEGKSQNRSGFPCIAFKKNTTQGIGT